MRHNYYKGKYGFLLPDMVRIIQDEYKAAFKENISAEQVALVVGVLLKSIKIILRHQREVKLKGFGRFFVDDMFTGKKTKKRIVIKMTEDFRTLRLDDPEAPII